MTEEIKKTTTRTRKTSATTKTTEVGEPKVEKEAVVEKRQLQDTDRILVMNNTNGIYGYYGANGFSFDLESYGQTLTIPLSELRTMASGQNRRHLTDAWIIILDEDVIEELNLGNEYKNIYTQAEIDDLLEQTEVIKEVFPKMPKNMKTVFVARARELVKEGKFNNFRGIRTIEELAKVTVAD